VFLVIAVILLFLAPSPWNVIGLVVGLVLFAGELVFWGRRVRGMRLQTGTDTLIGRSATVVTACQPIGQVRVIGAAEVWSARCEAGASVGETVRITGRDGLTLVVEVPSGT
jgi:membrane protein implicated in regulation of membrane protease activity